MTSKQRVQKALAREIPDRVPIDYESNEGINRRLMQHFKANNQDELLQALNVDFRGIGPEYKGKRLHKEVEGRNVNPLDGTVTRWVEHETGGYWDFCDFPLIEADEETVANWPLPNPDDFDCTNAVEMAKYYKDFGLYCGNPGLGCIINSNGFLRGMEQALIDLLIDEPAGLLLTDRRMKIDLAIMERLLDKCHTYIDVMWMGEDLGTQIAPFISKEVYNRNLRPYHQMFIDLAKSYNVKVMIHTCGSSSWVYPDFIEMGVDCVDTLQPEAVNMSPRYLKDTFGGKLSFHGCISTAGPLAYGTADEVEANVRETLDIMMPGGGYMICPTHQIQDNSPTENVVRMYECALKYGKY